MNALLVRVGADSNVGGGSWNGPVDTQSGKFIYVAIPETMPTYPGLEKSYSALAPILSQFGTKLPAHLRAQHMHLDPDFQHLTYGDQGERAKQLNASVGAGDIIAFYAGLADIRDSARLIYAIIGLFVINNTILAADVPVAARDNNAHSRRILAEGAKDLIVQARPAVSGRLERCLPIGEWRDRAYRLRPNLLQIWGGLSVKDGYLQRSARLPRILEPLRFLRWFELKKPVLLQVNN